MKIGDKVDTKYYGPGKITAIREDGIITVKTERVMLGRNCVCLCEESEVSILVPPIQTSGTKRPWTVNRVNGLNA